LLDSEGETEEDFRRTDLSAKENGRHVRLKKLEELAKVIAIL
jgi:hypothetical protein